MPRPQNTEKRNLVRTIFKKHFEDYPTKIAAVEATAKDLGMNPRTVFYYLADSHAKSRRTYSDHVRSLVALMDLEEIKKYAARIGRDWHRLYQIMLQEKSKDKGVKTDLSAAEKRREELLLYKVFNFSFSGDLRAFDLTLEQVRAAKKVLQAEFGLSLAAPNYLIDKKGTRRFDLDYQEQVLVVKHPKRFVVNNAERIGQGWRPYNEEATWMEMLGLDDPMKDLERPAPSPVEK